MYLEDALCVIQFIGNNKDKNITYHIVHSYFFIYRCNKRSRTKNFLHIMKNNEKICTSHISVEKVLAIFTKVNKVYATIRRPVKAHLVGIVLNNHRHISIETNCYPSTFLKKNDHTDPKIKKLKKWLMYTHNNSSTCMACNRSTSTKYILPCVCLGRVN